MAGRGYESIDLRPSESSHDLSTASHEPKPPLRVDDNASVNSHSPLHPNIGGFVYPSISTGKHIQVQDHGGRPMEGYDPERGRSPGSVPGSGGSTPNGTRRRSHLPRNSSWDLLAGIKNEYEEFDTRKVSEAHLAFAQGDIPDNKASGLFTQDKSKLHAFDLGLKILPLPTQCVYYYSMDTLHSAGYGDHLDSWYCWPHCCA